jgi:uncharacterized protein YggT (Ycf19 family)
MNLALIIASGLAHLAYYSLALFACLVALRYLLGFLPLHLNRVRRFLFQVTEPFLRYFGRLAKTHWRRHDFTPLIAALVLVVFQQTVLKLVIVLLLKARGSWCG